MALRPNEDSELTFLGWVVGVKWREGGEVELGGRGLQSTLNQTTHKGETIANATRSIFDYYSR